MMDKLERRWLHGVQCRVPSVEILIFSMYVLG